MSMRVGNVYGQRDGSLFRWRRLLARGYPDKYGPVLAVTKVGETPENTESLLKNIESLDKSIACEKCGGSGNYPFIGTLCPQCGGTGSKAGGKLKEKTKRETMKIFKWLKEELKEGKEIFFQYFKPSIPLIIAAIVNLGLFGLTRISSLSINGYSFLADLINSVWRAGGAVTLLMAGIELYDLKSEEREE